MIYFVKSNGSSYIKIGTSIDVSGRVDSLQTANPKELKVKAILNGSFQTEKGLHELFSHIRVRGEWFKWTDEMQYFIRTIRDNPSVENIYSLYRLSMQLRLTDKAKRLSARGNDKLRQKIVVARNKMDKCQSKHT